MCGRLHLYVYANTASTVLRSSDGRATMSLHLHVCVHHCACKTIHNVMYIDVCGVYNVSVLYI